MTDQQLLLRLLVCLLILSEQSRRTLRRLFLSLPVVILDMLHTQLKVLCHTRVEL